MILSATPAHIQYVTERMRGDDYVEVMAASGCKSDAAFLEACNALNGMKFTATHKGEPVAVCGVTFPVNSDGLLRPAQAWLFGTDDIGKCGVEIMHLVKDVRTYLFGTLEVVRVEAHSASFHKDAHRWLRRMGFEQEGLMQDYCGSGESFIRFSMTKGN